MFSTQASLSALAEALDADMTRDMTAIVHDLQTGGVDPVNAHLGAMEEGLRVFATETVPAMNEAQSGEVRACVRACVRLYVRAADRGLTCVGRACSLPRCARR